MGLNNAVEESAADEAEFTIDGCGGTTYIVPASSRVVGKGGIGVLEEGNCNYYLLARPG